MCLCCELYFHSQITVSIRTFLFYKILSTIKDSKIVLWFSFICSEQFLFFGGTKRVNWVKVLIFFWTYFMKGLIRKKCKCWSFFMNVNVQYIYINMFIKSQMNKKKNKMDFFYHPKQFSNNKWQNNWF